MVDASRYALLSAAQVTAAERMAMQGSTSGETLMERAGRAVAATVLRRFDRQPVLVLCGPGNNGGDGYVVARLLQDRGWPVRLAALVPRGNMQGDAAAMAQRWSGPVLQIQPALLEGPVVPLIVDAVFGSGLSRALPTSVAELLRLAHEREATIVAVDIPSGVMGDSGALTDPHAARADLTVAFTRRRPGHLLLPGRQHCGEVVLADIGVPGAAVKAQDAQAFENRPELWLGEWRPRTPDSHKSQFGNALICAGAEMTGAARLAAHCALRVGAGLVTIAAAPSVANIFRQDLAATIVTEVPDYRAFAHLLETRDFAGAVVGSGLPPEEAEHKLRMLRQAGVPVVADAGALTAFEDRADELADLLDENCLVTPHAGEYRRLTGQPLGNDKIADARALAQRLHCAVLLKGSDTVIAAPHGVALVQGNASPWLATAGTGDVLAGLAGGLLAQGLPAAAAGAAAAWLQTQSAAELGPGLIADDLPIALPSVLARMEGLRSAGAAQDIFEAPSLPAAGGELPAPDAVALPPPVIVASRAT